VKHASLLSLLFCLTASASFADAPDPGGEARAKALQSLVAPKAPTLAPVKAPTVPAATEPAVAPAAPELRGAEIALAPTLAPSGAYASPTPPPLPDIESQPEAVIRLLLEKVVNGEWWAAAGGLLWVVMWALGKYGARRFPWLGHPAAIIGITFLVSVAGGFFHSMVLGMAPSLPVLLAAVKAALVALVTRGGVALLQQQRLARASEAGVAAGVAVGSREEAVSTFTGNPKCGFPCAPQF
jgi:hypothetical protein